MSEPVLFGFDPGTGLMRPVSVDANGRIMIAPVGATPDNIYDALRLYYSASLTAGNSQHNLATVGTGYIYNVTHVACQFASVGTTAIMWSVYDGANAIFFKYSTIATANIVYDWPVNVFLKGSDVLRVNVTGGVGSTYLYVYTHGRQIRVA